MPNFTDLTGLIGVAAAIAASPLLLPWIRHLTARRQAWVTVAAFLIALVPINGFPVAAYVRGATGDLSITTLVLVWCALFNPTNPLAKISPPPRRGRAREGVETLHSHGFNPHPDLPLGRWKELFSSNEHRLALLALIALGALALYPMALGLGAFDPYRLGYANGWFVAALLLIALMAWLRKHYLLALCVSLAVLAWAVGWYESRNLWDYLLDPFVAIYALSALVIDAAKGRKLP